MNLSYRYIVALNLTLLILFSSIGFNIITTFCGGCDDEHTSVALVSTASDGACSCCESANVEDSCCALPTHSEEGNHQTTSKFAKLDFDSTEARENNFKVIQPIAVLPFILLASTLNLELPAKPFEQLFHYSPLKWGKSLLFHNCILRL